MYFACLVHSQPNYVFLDCGESTVDIQDIFLAPVMMFTYTESIVEPEYIYFFENDDLRRCNR